MAVVLESSQLPIAIACVAALLGFVVGLGARALLPKARVKLKPPIHVAERDRERFFRFTWLVLDVLPCYLRVHFKLLWDAKYAHTLQNWGDSPGDGDSFWNGVYDERPFSTCSMTQGEWTIEPSQDAMERLSPRRKIRVDGCEYRVVAAESKKKSKCVHLNKPARSTGTFEAFDQTVLCETNCAPSMAKIYQAKILTGDCQLWDISLVCFALLHSSHKLLVDELGRSQVEAVRNLRNNKLAHIKSCRMDPIEMVDAINTMDLYVSGNLPSSLLAEWCHASRQVLHEVVTMPKQMPAAGLFDVRHLEEDQAQQQPLQLQSSQQLLCQSQPQQQQQPQPQQPQPQLQQQHEQQNGIRQNSTQSSQPKPVQTPIRQQTRQQTQSTAAAPTEAPALQSSQQPSQHSSLAQSASRGAPAQRVCQQQGLTLAQTGSSGGQFQPTVPGIAGNVSQDAAQASGPDLVMLSASRAIQLGSTHVQHSLCGKDGRIQQLRVPAYFSEKQNEILNQHRWLQELGVPQEDETRVQIIPHIIPHQADVEAATDCSDSNLIFEHVS